MDTDRDVHMGMDMDMQMQVLFVMFNFVCPSYALWSLRFGLVGIEVSD